MRPLFGTFVLFCVAVGPALAVAQTTQYVTDGTFNTTAYGSTAYQLPNGQWGPAQGTSGALGGWVGPGETALALGGASPAGPFGASGLAGWEVLGGPAGFPGGNTTTDATNPLLAWYPTVAAATTASPVNEYNDGKQYFAAVGALANSTVPGGGGLLYLDADPAYRGVLAQTITGMTVGTYYTLTFDWAAGQLVNRSGPTTEQLAVSLGQNSFASSSFGSQKYFTTGTVSLGPQGVSFWQQGNYTFVASQTTEILSFLAYGTPAGEPPSVLLTDVSLVLPEPGSVAVLGVGLLALVRLRRGMNRRV